MYENDVYVYDQLIGPAEATPTDVVTIYQRYAANSAQFRVLASFTMNRWEEQSLPNQTACTHLHHLASTIETTHITPEPLHAAVA
jgi:hypothetical protein